MSKQQRDWGSIGLVAFGVVASLFCTFMALREAGKPKNPEDDYYYQRRMMELKAEQDFKKMQEGK